MASVLKLIEKQLEWWELQRRLENLDRRPGRCLCNGAAYGPCLLISRECGSGGGRVAQLAGQRLGWQMFDREILDEIANLAHVRLELLQSVDEQVRTQWEENWSPELTPEDIGRESYLRYLRQVVMILGHHGEVVILGRGAQYLLPSPCALRVRLIAPLEVRAQRIAESKRMPLEEARRQIERFDAERAIFVRKSFQREANSPFNYDLVINTAEISVEGAVELAMEGLHRKLGVRPRAQ